MEDHDREREIREALRRLREEGTISTQELEEALADALTHLIRRQLTSYKRSTMRPNRPGQPKKSR
jgi:hypothetical protein